jgi:hypothetical protein
MSSLKERGNIATHDNRPRLSKAQWDAMIVDDEVDDEDEISIAELWRGLINSLAEYVPPPLDPSDPWVIVDPATKPKSAISISKLSTTASTDSSTASTPVP